MLRTRHAHQLPPSMSLSHPPLPQHQLKDPHVFTSTPRRRYLGPLLLCAFLCFLGVGVYMWPRVQGVRLAYRLQAAEQRMSDLIQERDHLRLELAALKDPQRVFRVATEELGMVTPKPDQVFVLVRESKQR